MSVVKSTTPFDYRLHYQETGIVWKLSTFFLEHIPFGTDSLIFYCIGTDRSTGDALGPLTGSHLKESMIFPFEVIGTLEDPLHALNLKERLQETIKTNPTSYIIAIDACLDKSDTIGHVIFSDGPLYPGKAVGKDLPPVGQMSIKGIVNIAGFMEQAVLQSTRLHLSFEMSRVIARALQLAYGRFTKSKRNIC